MTASFKDVVFVRSDLRGSLFIGCAFENVDFRNCLTHGLLFIDCTFRNSSFVFDEDGEASEVRTLTFRSCTFEGVDGTARDALTLKGIRGGYGVFFDGCDGPVTIGHSKFNHLGGSSGVSVTLDDTSEVGFVYDDVLAPHPGTQA